MLASLGEAGPPGAAAGADTTVPAASCVVVSSPEVSRSVSQPQRFRRTSDMGVKTIQNT